MCLELRFQWLPFALAKVFRQANSVTKSQLTYLSDFVSNWGNNILGFKWIKGRTIVHASVVVRFFTKLTVEVRLKTGEDFGIVHDPSITEGTVYLLRT
jgi:hypothetical protein